MFRVRMKRILGSGIFWGSVLLLTVIMVLGVYEDLRNARANSLPVLYLYMVTSTVGISHVLIPIITMIPFAFFYVEELEKKGTYYNLIRCRKRSYYGSNIATAVLSSMLVPAFALLIFVLVCLVCGAEFECNYATAAYYEGTVYELWLEDSRQIFVLLIRFLAFVVYSVPWGLVCLAVSIFSRNKYVILAAPFIIGKLVSFCAQAMSLYLLDPGMTLLSAPIIQRMPYGGILYALGYHLILLIALAVFYYTMSRRRYRREGI